MTYPTGYFQPIVHAAAQESGLMVIGAIPTSGSLVTAQLHGAGQVLVELGIRVDDGLDRDGVAWSTWTWVPGSLRAIEVEDIVAKPPTWRVIRNQTGTIPNGLPLRRCLYSGEDETRARHLYETWSTGIRNGSVQLVRDGTVISETRAPRRSTR